jgi:hypothetical protein
MVFKDSVLRSFIKEHVRGVVFFGLKKIDRDTIEKSAPRFYGRLKGMYGIVVDSGIFAKKSFDKLQPTVFYALLPDERRTLAVWKDDQLSFSSNSDLIQAIEKL